MAECTAQLPNAVLLRDSCHSHDKLGNAGDLELLEWLCSGTFELGATAERKRELGVLHKAMYTDIVGVP